MRDERFTILAPTDATQVPDSLLLDTRLDANTKILAAILLMHQKNQDAPPTIDMLADELGVVVRTVRPWIDRLRAVGMIVQNRAGKYRTYSVPRRAAPHQDGPNPATKDRFILRSANRGSTRRAAPRPNALDRSTKDEVIHSSYVHDSARREKVIDSSYVHDSASKSDRFILRDSPHSNAPNPATKDESITDPPVGVGVGQHESDSDSPTTNRAPLKTELARYLKRAGMNAAREFDDPALDYATYRAFVEDKRMLGWEWRQIVSTLREAPLNTDAQPPPLDIESYADQPGDALGSDLPPPQPAPESIGDIARRLLPPDASTADWVFIQSRLVRHDSEAGALEALAARRAARR